MQALRVVYVFSYSWRAAFGPSAGLTKERVMSEALIKGIEEAKRLIEEGIQKEMREAGHEFREVKPFFNTYLGGSYILGILGKAVADDTEDWDDWLRRMRERR